MDIEVIFKRMDRRMGLQTVRDTCVICGNAFEVCKHNMAQIDAIRTAWATMNTLGRKKVH